jgi:hypothetical protein
MTIRFFCTCGQALTAPDQYVGQTVRCMTCNELQVVPQTAAPGGPVSVWGSEELDGVPSSRTPGSWRARLAQGAAVILLLVGVAGLWWLFFRSDSAISSEYDLVPRDALAFFTVKVSDVLKSPSGASAKRLAQVLPDSDVVHDLGVKLEDIDRLTAVTYDFELASWVILHMVKDYDAARLVHESTFSMEAAFQGRPYYTDGRHGLLLIDRRTLVVGPNEGIERCLSLPQRRERGTLDEAIRLASRNEHPAVAGVNGPRFAHLVRTRSKGWVDLIKPKELFDARLLTATGDISDKVNIEVRIDFGTADTAELIVREITPLIPQAQGMLLGVSFFRLGGDPQKLNALAAKGLDQLVLKQDGKVVHFHLAFEMKELLGTIENEDRRQ